jgi:hypothetical protein
MAEEFVPTPSKPLGPQHLDIILKGIAQAQEGLNGAELAERAGVNVDQHKASLNRDLKTLQSIKQTYFPHA